MENYYLFLDDERNPKDVTWITIPKKTWVIARTYKEFVSLITEKGRVPSFVSYDHDLSDYASASVSLTLVNKHGISQADQRNIGEKTGYDCSKWLVNYCLDLKVKHPPYAVHSLNPVGADNICAYVDNYNLQHFNECACDCNCNCNHES